jgi:hypothetical protein
MIRDEILNMPAGKEIDALIAEKVMGWHKADHHGRECWLDANKGYQRGIASGNGFEDDEDFHLLHWHPSESILWAWEVIEKMQEIDSHWSPGVNWDDDDGDGNPMWVASFTYYGESEKDFRVNEVWDKSAPLAICRAALLAVMS